MRFLYFHQHFNTPEGTVGVRSYQMASTLVSRGHHVTMVCGRYNGAATGLEGPFVGGRRRGTVNGIDVIELEIDYSNGDGFARRTLSFLSFALKSISVALREDYDVLIATSTPLTAGIPGILARWLRGKPFVFEVRDLWPELPRAMGVIRNPIVLWGMGVLEWLSYHSATRLIGLSPGIVAGIAHRGVDEANIALIPNGCDLDIFSQSVAPARPEGVAPEDLLALFAGTHGVANGLDAVLDAASVLKRRDRGDIKFVLAGEGKLKVRLQDRAREKGLRNVIFLDPMGKSRLAKLMMGADVGLQVLANVPAFYYGTSPNKFFDYISSGLPVVTNYPGWIADMIVANDCGFAVPPEDAEAFADALENAADNRGRFPAMKGNALKVAEGFDRRILADRFVTWVEGAGRS
ncbi:glycosyltransferase family 4 protein [Brevundimonas sp. BR2-1]|uniref:glycosyltransferase family 4 protein n=1 Tax=Brevundimonas sp. BR2-1 TaxID=3031123 RepID=UPI0030AEC96F